VKKKVQKKKKQSSSSEEEECFEFRRIVKERGNRGRKEYLVEWKDNHPPSWIAEIHLKGQEALREWKIASKPDPIVVISESELIPKIKQMATWFKDSNRIVFHVGAGISTSAGVPDFRGEKGLWTTNARDISDFDITKVKPTTAHRTLVALQKQGKIHHLITQNYDDLFQKSGFPRDHLSEVHGNLFEENCQQCQIVYRSHVPVEKDNEDLPEGNFDHRTGNKCTKCGGDLEDTIVHFGEALKDSLVAESKAKEADLSIVIGSKLEVTPACDWPFLARSNKGRVIICNLQKTPKDSCADLVIHHYSDHVLELLLKELEITLEEFRET